MSKILRWNLLVVLGVFVAFVGCGDDDDDGGATPTAGKGGTSGKGGTAGTGGKGGTAGKGGSVAAAGEGGAGGTVGAGGDAGAGGSVAAGGDAGAGGAPPSATATTILFDDISLACDDPPAAGAGGAGGALGAAGAAGAAGAGGAPSSGCGAHAAGILDFYDFADDTYILNNDLTGTQVALWSKNSFGSTPFTAPTDPNNLANLADLLLDSTDGEAAAPSMSVVVPFDGTSTVDHQVEVVLPLAAFGALSGYSDLTGRTFTANVKLVSTNLVGCILKVTQFSTTTDAGVGTTFYVQETPRTTLTVGEWLMLSMDLDTSIIPTAGNGLGFHVFAQCP